MNRCPFCFLFSAIVYHAFCMVGNHGKQRMFPKNQYKGCAYNGLSEDGKSHGF